MARKRTQRSQDRVVGKMGGSTRAGKAFGKMVAEWTAQKSRLVSAGYTVAYDKEASERAYSLLYRITFPDGHTELMTSGQAMAITPESE